MSALASIADIYQHARNVRKVQKADIAMSSRRASYQSAKMRRSGTPPLGLIYRNAVRWGSSILLGDAMGIPR
jgi:hypothetical protein